jgi:hypothetical protein
LSIWEEAVACSSEGAAKVKAEAGPIDAAKIAAPASAAKEIAVKLRGDMTLILRVAAGIWRVQKGMAAKRLCVGNVVGPRRLQLYPAFGMSQAGAVHLRDREKLTKLAESGTFGSLSRFSDA